LVIKEHRFVLAVPDLSRSAEFYREVLGFEVHEIGDPGWRFFVKDSCLIMAGECPDAMPARDLGDHSYFGYLVVDEVDDYYERAVAKDAEIIKPLRNEPWGMREFGLRTPDGHRLMLGSRLVPASPP
jgi:catechol 2,3-dioxygenase-like lactoylglutathione lyase family enzyme